MTQTDNTSTKPDSTANPQQNIVTVLKKRCTKMMHDGYHFLINSKLYEDLEEISEYLVEHPILMILFISFTATFIIPMLIFSIIAVTYVVFTVTGFIIVIVSALAVGALVLCSLLFFIIMTIGVIGICILMIWSLSSYTISLMRTLNILP